MTIRRAPADVVQFTRESAERISRVVRESETAPLPGSPLKFGSIDGGGLAFERTDDGGGGGGGRGGTAIRVVTFTGSWSIGSLKEVTFQGAATTPNTVMATNQLFTIGDACTTQVAYIGKVSSLAPAGATADWHLLSVQHHETALVVSVTLTTAALEFTRRLAWIPYPGETSTFSIQVATDTACSS